MMLRRYSEVLSFTEKNLNLLKKRNLLNYCYFLHKSNTSPDYAEQFLSFMGDYSKIHINDLPFVYFNCGQFFLKNQNFPLALLFLKKAEHLFQKINCQMMVWRVRFNLILFSNLVQKNIDKLSLKLLEEQFYQLEDMAQIYFSSYLVAIYNNKSAYHLGLILLSSLEDKVLQLAEPAQIDNYAKDVVYLENKLQLLGKKSDVEMIQSKRLFEITTRSVVLDEFTFILNSRFVDPNELIKRWEVCNQLDIFLLLDLTLTQFLKNNFYDEAVKLLHLFRTKLLQRTPLLPDSDLEKYDIIFKFRTDPLGAVEHQKDYLKRIAVSGVDCIDEISLLVNKVIVINSEDGAVVCENKKIRFSLDSLIYRLFLFISERKIVSRNEVQRSFAGDSRSKIDQTIYRLKKRLPGVIGSNSEQIFLLNGYSVEVLQVAKSIRYREQLILSFITNAHLGVSVGQIEQALRIKRRTLQKDLSRLVAKKKIIRSGKNKSAKYFKV